MAWRACVAALVAAAGLAGCAGGGAGGARCGAVEEILEGVSSGHVIRADAASYRHHPPTSGPHLPVDVEPGVRTQPVGEAEQVGGLERGLVILQYEEGEIDDDEVAALARLAGGDDPVLVMPSATPIDGDASVVAFTAWGNRQRCTGVSIDAARAFVERFAGVGAEDAGAVDPAALVRARSTTRTTGELTGSATASRVHQRRSNRLRR